MKSIASKHIILETLRYAYDKTLAASDVLDGKLQSILSFSSVMVSIASAVLASTLLDHVGILFWIILVTVLILYIVTFLIIYNGLKPRSFYLPVSENIETIEKLFYKASENDALNQSIVDYTHFRKLIENVNNFHKTLAVNRASKLMAAMVCLLILAAPIGLLFPAPTLPALISRWIH